jgi:asparagine synthase (glutamine-hydrolysing)
VALSGDGGDELFGGYERYARATRVWNRYRMLPGWGRKLARTMVGTLTPEQWQALSARVLPNGKRRQPVDDKVSKLTDLLRMHDPQQLYRRLVSHWERPSSVVLHASEPPTLWTERAAWSEHPDFMDWMMYTDMVTYLPDDILTKVDRASMGVSLEARTPLVDDHRLVEKSWHLPLSMKIRAGTSKWLLRQVLYQYVPRAMIERPKRGFSVPIDRWLRGPLRDWAETLLNENRLRQEGYFNPTPIRRMWDEHLQGKYDRQYHLWDVLMFQAWLDAQAQPAPAAG